MLPPPVPPMRPSDNITPTKTPGRDGVSSSSSSGESRPFGPVCWCPRGIFEGRYIRFLLEVVQEPIHGRRKTDKDRRPLAHCPIVRLRMMSCRKNGESWDEEEVDPSSIDHTHFVCAAELSPPTSSHPSGTVASSTTGFPDLSAGVSQSTAGPSTGFPQTSTSPSIVLPPTDPIQPITNSSLRRLPADAYDDADTGSLTPSSYRSNPGPSSVLTSSSGRRRGSGSQGYAHDRSAGSSDEDGSAPREDGHVSKRVRARGGRNLYGSLHVAGVRVPAMEGGMGLWFLFTDLTVRHEGTYELVFRCFDISAIDPSLNAPALHLVECRSQAFKVYSPRNFPGLPKPTLLAEHFARQGFKLNTRKNERQIQESPPPPAEPPPVPRPSATAQIHRPATSPVQTSGPSTGDSTDTGVFSWSVTTSESMGSEAGRYAPSLDTSLETSLGKDSVGDQSSTSRMDGNKM